MASFEDTESVRNEEASPRSNTLFSLKTLLIAIFGFTVIALFVLWIVSFSSSQHQTQQMNSNSNVSTTIENENLIVFQYWNEIAVLDHSPNELKCRIYLKDSTTLFKNPQFSNSREFVYFYQNHNSAIERMNFSSKRLGETKCQSLNEHFTIDRTDPNGVFYPFSPDMIKYFNFATGKKVEYKAKCSTSKELQVLFHSKSSSNLYYGCRDGEIVTIYKKALDGNTVDTPCFVVHANDRLLFSPDDQFAVIFPAYTSDIKVFNLLNGNSFGKSLGQDFRHENTLTAAFSIDGSSIQVLKWENLLNLVVRTIDFKKLLRAEDDFISQEIQFIEDQI